MERYEPKISSEEPGYAAEARHFELCRRCGQYVDGRDPMQVRHHQRLSHRPMNFDE